jgi:hypothetical protein
MKPHRMFFDVFDNMYFGKSEKILLENITSFRDMIKVLIKERRDQIKNDSQFLENNTDFLTILLTDELF